MNRDPASIDVWLKNLEQALKTLPAALRDDIAREARSHLDERLQAGLSPQSALHGFGDAKTYAQPFVDDFELNAALSSNKSWRMAKVVVKHGLRSLTTLFGLSLIVTFSGIGLAAGTCLLFKLSDPHRAGLWISAPGQRMQACMGVCANHPATPELLGAAFYPVFATLFAASCLIVHLGLRVTARGLLRSKPAAG